MENANVTVVAGATQGRAKQPKWHETEGFKFAEGQVVKCLGNLGILKDRLVKVTGPSAKKHALKGYLINSKDGSLQGTHITLDYSNVVPAFDNMEAYEADRQAKIAADEAAKAQAAAAQAEAAAAQEPSTEPTTEGETSVEPTESTQDEGANTSEAEASTESESENQPA